MRFAGLKPVMLLLPLPLLLATVMSFSRLPGATAQTPGADVRLSNDFPGGGYISAYTLATGATYTDAMLAECSVARGRQNEPAVAVNPRDARVLVGSSNDYCGVYAGSSPGNFVPAGPIWLGYYRSEDGGTSFQSSLVPGYPGDTSPYAALAHVRTASAGDPVIAWDNRGRVFMGAESSDDPAGTKKTFGDVWVARFDNPAGEGSNPQNDGKRFLGAEIIARGSAAPNTNGLFHDKTAIEVDRTGGPTDGNVYFAWSRYNGFGNNAIYFARSTDHGATWSQPMKLTEGTHSLQFPDIAVTGDGHVYVTFRQFQFLKGRQQQNAVAYVKSTDGGLTFSRPQLVTTFAPYDAQDVSAPEPDPTTAGPAEESGFEKASAAAGGLARDCGDFASHCRSGYTFFRRDTQVRSTADQGDKQHEWVYIVYDPTKPGTEVGTGTTYGSIRPGLGSQSGIYFTRLNGATGEHTTPVLLDAQAAGHQLFPDVSADGGVLHALWWDSRNDPCYSPARPVGNCADQTTVPALDVWAARSTDAGATWTNRTRVTDYTSNPNYEQFSDRTVPFAGDYLWVTSLGSFSYGAWTDWRDTVQGVDPREVPEDEDDFSADVKQCRTFDQASKSWSGDQCPHDGGLDQNIYGDHTP